MNPHLARISLGNFPVQPNWPPKRAEEPLINGIFKSALVGPCSSGLGFLPATVLKTLINQRSPK